MTDQTLISNIQQGDEKAFKALVTQHQQQVLRTCVGFVHNNHDAEDLAQEVFVEVYHSIHKFRNESKLSTWIFRIAVNKSLNFIRDSKRKKIFQSIENTLFKSEHTEMSADSWSERPDLKLENDQRKIKLHKAIDSLPERQRVAFTMSKIEDLSYLEIANVMGLSVSSVESLIHRAKINLQKKLYQCYKKGI